MIVAVFTDIKMEAIDSRVEVKSFDHSKLKHADTKEKNVLPDAQSKTVSLFRMLGSLVKNGLV